MNEELQLLLDANRVVASTLDIDKLLGIIMDMAARVVKAETASLLLVDEGTDELYFDVALGEAGDQLKRIRLKIGEGIAGWVAKEGRPLVVKDVANDPRWTKKADDSTGFITKSIICVPLRVKGKIIGVIEGINRIDRDYFLEQDVPLFEAFAAQAAVAIENARLFGNLRQEKDKIEATFSGMSEGVIVTDGKGIVSQFNLVATKFFGLTDEESPGKNLQDILKKAGFEIIFDDITNSTEKIFSCELSRDKNLGKEFFLSMMSTKILDDKGETAGYIVVFRDITSQKKEERLKRTFLSLVSHKLRTPLVSITGYAPLLLEDDGKDKLNPFQLKAITSIKTQGEQLKSLVDTLLTFTMVDAESLELSRKEVLIEKLILDGMATVKARIENNKAEVVIDESVKNIQVFVDEEKMKEVFKNLIDNGIKFNKNESKNITISGKKINGEIQIEVKDNGGGIPPEEHEKIFQKFYQIEESFTGQIEGAGLGLPLVKRVIESHNGRVWVESETGKGSKFLFTIPIK